MMSSPLAVEKESIRKAKRYEREVRLVAISLCSLIFLNANSCSGGSGGPGGPSGPGPSGPTGPTSSGPTGPTGPTGTSSTGSAGPGTGGPTGGAPGGTGKGYPPLITPQTDTGELMVPASPVVTAMPTTSSTTRPFYQTSGTAVDIRFRRQVDVTNLKITFDVGYIGETTAP